VISDDELRINHEFVTAFETLRKRHGHREMSDAALRDVADAAGIEFETLRVSRHLRNALAHDEPVNRDTLLRYLGILTEGVNGPKRRAGESAVSLPRPDVRAYRVHAWLDADLEREMLANGFVSVGGAEIGDLTGVTDAEYIRSELTRTMTERAPRAINLFVGYWRRFLWEAESGNLVALPTRDRCVAIGEFVGPYFYVADAGPHARHRREVAWIGPPVSRNAFGHDLLVTLNGQHTVQDFKAEGAARRLLALSESGLDPG
jgi:hypothetical protein